MDGETTGTHHTWEQRRSGAESRRIGGTVAAVGSLLCVLGIALALAKGVGPRHNPGVDAALWVVAFVVLGILVLLAGRILDAIHVDVDRR